MATLMLIPEKIAAWCSALLSTLLALLVSPAAADTPVVPQKGIIIVTGQSLSAGGLASPALSTTQPYQNLMVLGLTYDSAGTGTPSYLVYTPSRAAFPWTPLIESSLESPRSAMANYYTSVTGNSVYVVTGTKGGSTYVLQKKGTEPFEQMARSIEAVGARTGLPCIAIYVEHGESDGANSISRATYAANLVEWRNDIVAKCQKSAGGGDPPMYIGQYSSWTAPILGSLPTSNVPLAIYDVARAYPGKFHVVDPHYMDAYQPDGVHKTNAASRTMGARGGRAIAQGSSYQPFWPRRTDPVSRSGNVLTTHFYTPTPPIVIDTTNITGVNATTKGFEYTCGSSPPAITNVDCSAACTGNDCTCTITLASTPSGACAVDDKLRYALTGVAGNFGGPSSGPRGNLRDSTVNTWAGASMYHPLVHFEEPIPDIVYNIVAVGNSLVGGQDAGGQPWPTQLATKLTHAGVPFTISNKGHGANATEYLADRPNFSLTYKIPADVDPLFNTDPLAVNILIFQEVINDIYYGSTGAQAYANVVTYMNTLANSNWFKIVIMPTPRDNPGTVQPTYDNERQNFLDLVTADPTFSGTVDAVWRVDQDTRLGLANSDNDGYYYFLSGGADTKTHWLSRAHAIATSALMDILDTNFPGAFPFKPQYSPWPAALFSAAKTGSVLTSSGGPAANGQTVSTWVHDGSLESGNLNAEGAGTQTYSTTGFGGDPAITMAVNSSFVTTGAIGTGRGTLAVTVYATSPGFATWGNLFGSDRRLYAAADGDAYDVTGMVINSTIYAATAAPAGTVVGAPHVIVFTFDGTAAGQKVFLDGTQVGTTSSTGDPGEAFTQQVFHVGHVAASLVGSIGEVYISPIPLSTAERKRLENSWGALRGITIAP